MCETQTPPLPASPFLGQLPVRNVFWAYDDKAVGDLCRVLIADSCPILMKFAMSFMALSFF